MAAGVQISSALRRPTPSPLNIAAKYLGLGTFVRSRRDRALAWQTSAGGLVAASVGNFSSIALFNGDARGRSLAVYGLVIFQSASGNAISVNQLFGSTGSLLQAGANMTAGYAPAPGQLNQLQQAGHNGSLIAVIGGFSVPFSLLQDEPLFIVPPNYSLVFETRVVNLLIEVSLIWSVY